MIRLELLTGQPLTVEIEVQLMDVEILEDCMITSVPIHPKYCRYQIFEIFHINNEEVKDLVDLLLTSADISDFCTF